MARPGFLFLSCLLMLAGCEILSPERQHLGPLEVQRIDHIREWPQSGVFYLASARDGLTADSQHEVEALLARIQVQGAELNAAWYKEGGPECTTPYRIALMMEVESQLVIQLAAAAPAGAMRGFTRVEEPHMMCPYYVQRFIPMRN